MTDANRKPWLTASEQIDHLKSRGVHFSLMSEDDAKAYLENNSNYFRLRAYRLGFPKVEEEVRKGDILQGVKSLRNACAHNSYILNNLRADRPQFKPSYVVTRELSTIAGIGLD